MRATVPSSGGQARRVARVDAGLLSLTCAPGSVDVGPLPLLSLAVVLSRCATLARSKPWDRARWLFLFHSLCSSLTLTLTAAHVRCRARTHTYTRTPSTRARARARACIRSRTHGAQAHTRANTREIRRGRTHARARAPTIVLFIPLVSTLPQRPRSFFLEAMSSFATSSTTTATATTTYQLSLSPTLSSPSIFLRLSLSTLFRPLSLAPVAAGSIPAPSRHCPTFDVSPSEQRGRHTKGRSLTTPDPRPSREFLTLDEFHPSRRFLARVLRTPRGSSTLCVLSCRESALSSVPTVANRVTASPRASPSRSGLRGN